MFLFPWVLFAMVLDNDVAAFCAAENTEEKNPPVDWGENARVPPGVFVSSMVGVNGAVMALESLLGGFVAERARRCDIMFPEGETTITLGFDCVWVCFAPAFALEVDRAGDAGAFASVGVGGVTKVVGASPRFGGVAGIWVMILFGALTGRLFTGGAGEASWTWSGDACTDSLSSKILLLRCFPPKNEPIPLPLVLGRLLSAGD